MYTNQLIAIVAATLITASGLFAITHYSNAAVSAQTRIHASVTGVLTTLPTIEVRPTAEQLSALGINRNH